MQAMQPRQLSMCVWKMLSSGASPSAALRMMPDASARRVHLLAPEDVGGAGGKAEAAVHALVHDGRFGCVVRVEGAGFGGGGDLCERGLCGEAGGFLRGGGFVRERHQMPPTKRPGLRMRAGSNSCLMARMSSMAGGGSPQESTECGSRPRRRRTALPPWARRRERRSSVSVARFSGVAEKATVRMPVGSAMQRARVSGCALSSAAAPTIAESFEGSVETLRTVASGSAKRRSRADQTSASEGVSGQSLCEGAELLLLIAKGVGFGGELDVECEVCVLVAKLHGFEAERSGGDAMHEVGELRDGGWSAR